MSDVALFCGIHMKRSMHLETCTTLGIAPERAVYLDDTGHMSGIDPLMALDRASRSGLLTSGDLVLMIAAGTGYTWAGECIRDSRTLLQIRRLDRKVTAQRNAPNRLNQNLTTDTG